MMASVRSTLTSGAMRDKVLSSSDRGPSMRQYCFGIGAPAMICVTPCKRVPSPPARTSAHNDAFGISVGGPGLMDVICMLLRVRSSVHGPAAAERLQECRPQSSCLRQGNDIAWSAMKKRGHCAPKLGSRAEPRQTRIAKGRSGGLLDPESLDHRLERRPLRAETRGRTPWTAQHPASRSE